MLCQQLCGRLCGSDFQNWFLLLCYALFDKLLCPLWQTPPMLTLCETVLTCIGLADSVISVCVCYKKGGRSDMKVAVALLWAPIWAPSFPTSTHWKYLDEGFVVGVSLAMFKFVNYFCSVLCADMTIQLIFLTVIHLSKIFFESMNSVTKFGRLS